MDILWQKDSALGLAARVFLLANHPRPRAHTESQREESGESQFQGSLWRATLSREAWMPIWGLSTESDFASPPPDGGKAGEPTSGGDGGGGRGIEESTTRTDPSRTERLHPGKAQ